MFSTFAIVKLTFMLQKVNKSVLPPMCVCVCVFIYLWQHVSLWPCHSHLSIIIKYQWAYVLLKKVPNLCISTCCNMVLKMSGYSHTFVFPQIFIKNKQVLSMIQHFDVHLHRARYIIYTGRAELICFQRRQIFTKACAVHRFFWCLCIFDISISTRLDYILFLEQEHHLCISIRLDVVLTYILCMSKPSFYL